MSRLFHPLAAFALVAFAASTYAQTNPGNPSDPANQPATMPPSEQPATDRGDSSASGNSSAQSGPMTSTTAPSAAREQNTRLAAVVPSGMSTVEACDGFKGVKECATALHAARNLDIPFADLKSKVTAGERLTAALNELKPGVDAKSEVEKAERQAGMDLRPPEG
jgi:hypothetical protein